MENFHQEIIDFVKGLDDDLIHIDLSQFLASTESLNSEPSERLRQLAVLLEHQFFPPTEERWALLNSIYLKGIQENSNDAIIHESRGISATLFFEDSHKSDFKNNLFDIAEESFNKSLELGNNDFRLYFNWGMLYYPLNYEKAIIKFEKALHLEQNTIAQMYLGYSYFDLSKWEKAILAFRKVNNNDLRGHWEIIKKQELIGCALINSKQVEEGLKLLKEKVISEYKLGRYYSDDLEFDLAYPSEMIKTFKKHKMDNLANEVEKLVK